MQTNLSQELLATADGAEADRILRSCVHCGFCTATCPTYRLLGDELDSPRGRIYLVKAMLEAQAATRSTQEHLDRCLTCRACESTCPSGVQYGRLLDIGRSAAERFARRPLGERVVRAALRRVLPYPRRFGTLLRLGRWLRPVLPRRVADVIPPATAEAPWPQIRHQRRMIIAPGCVQRGLNPGIDVAAARVFDRAGISLLRPVGGGCCGALSRHLVAEEEARRFARANIDAWWPVIEAGAEAIVVTASGCGTEVKDYGHLLAADPDYACRAAKVGALTRDPVEVLAEQFPAPAAGSRLRVAFHSPCSLQHGQKLAGVTERLLARLGYDLTPVADSHLCCGSAGTYSILQPGIAQRLLADKVAKLEAGNPDLIATANIGCWGFLRQRASRPVVHWIELLDRL